MTYKHLTLQVLRLLTQDLVEHINDLLGVIINSTSDESLRAQLRELQLKKLFL